MSNMVVYVGCMVSTDVIIWSICMRTVTVGHETQLVATANTEIRFSCVTIHSGVLELLYLLHLLFIFLFPNHFCSIFNCLFGQQINYAQHFHFRYFRSFFFLLLLLLDHHLLRVCLTFCLFAFLIQYIWLIFPSSREKKYQHSNLKPYHIMPVCEITSWICLCLQSRAADLNRFNYPLHTGWTWILCCYKLIFQNK